MHMQKEKLFSKLVTFFKNVSPLSENVELIAAAFPNVRMLSCDFPPFFPTKYFYAKSFMNMTFF